MPFNGAGVFNRVYSWVQDKANGIFVTASRMDTEMDGMATGLSTCLTKDGQSTPTANIPMGGKKIINLAPGVSSTDAVNMSQIGAITGSGIYTAQVYNVATNQTITANTLTKIAWDTHGYDPYSEWSIVTNRFTPLNTGLYQVSLSVYAKNASADSLIVQIYIGGGTLIYHEMKMPAATNQTIFLLFVTGIAAPASSQYLEGYIYSANGTGTVTGNQYSSYMQVTRLGNFPA